MSFSVVLPLTEAQRVAWMVAAKSAMSNPRLNQSGSLSGFLLFTKINCTLAQFGQEQVDAPPDPPQFPALAPQNLSISQHRRRDRAQAHLPNEPGREHHHPWRRAPQPRPRDLYRLPGPGHLPGRRPGLSGHHQPLHGALWRAAGGQEGVHPGQPGSGRVGKPDPNLLGHRPGCGLSIHFFFFFFFF